jgi:hypothetical protein
LGFSELRGIALNPLPALMRTELTQARHLKFVAEVLLAKNDPAL